MIGILSTCVIKRVIFIADMVTFICSFVKLGNKQLWVHVQFTCHNRNMHFVVKYNGSFTAISYVSNVRRCVYSNWGV
jgi:hypothetical protein